MRRVLALADSPTTLIEAFRATLNDAVDAHLLIHVCDISHPDHVVQRSTVLKTLRDLDIPASKLESMITVYNKADLFDKHNSEGEETDDDQALYISCQTGQGLDQLVQLVQQRLMIASDRVTHEYRVLQGGQLYQILSQGDICNVEEMTVDEQDSQFIRLKCLFSRTAFDKFQSRYAGAAKYRVSD